MNFVKFPRTPFFIEHFWKFHKIHRKTPVAKSLFFLCYFFRSEACNVIKKETWIQVFSSEFCEISKNIFFCRTLLVAAFVYLKLLLFQGGLDQLIKTDQNMVTKRTCKDSGQNN